MLLLEEVERDFYKTCLDMVLRVPGLRGNPLAIFHDPTGIVVPILHSRGGNFADFVERRIARVYANHGPCTVPYAIGAISTTDPVEHYRYIKLTNLAPREKVKVA